jgi:hypothetical protein
MLSILKKREPADRSSLLAAIEASDRAQQTLDDAQAKYSRLEEVSHSGDVASRDASNALRAATEGRQSWVRAGCPFAGHAEVQRLDGEAVAAAAAAESASLDTKAVGRELGLAEATVRRAEATVQECERSIDHEIGLILLGEFAPVLEEFRRVTDQRHQLHIRIRGFIEGCGVASALQVLNECQVKPIEDWQVTRQGSHVGSPPPEVLKLAAEWRQRAAELREAPLC